MKYENIIIDANNLFWRSIVACLQKSLEIEEVKVNSHAIQEFIDRINQIRSQYGYNSSTIYLLFDNPKHTINLRKMIDENYKHNRTDKKVPDAFWDTLALLQEVLKSYSNNLVIMKSDHCEADDLVYPLLKKIDKTKNILLISADMDWSRGMSESNNIHWFNYHTLYNTKDIFRKKYGFNPDGNKVKLYKSIRGDHSDCIENAVPHLPETILLELINKYDTLEDLISGVQFSSISTNWKIKFKEAESQLKINYQLVDYINIDNSIEVLAIKCEENLNTLKYWYSCLDMTYENRMFNKDDPNNLFLQKKKHKRVKRI